MRRLLVVAAALVAAASVSGGLLLTSAAAGGERDVYRLARDLPAGAALSQDAVRSERLAVGAAAPLLVTPGAKALERTSASHDLHAGDLLLRSDLVAAGAPGADRRAVLLPLKEPPPLEPGGRLDLLAISGPQDHLAVIPVAQGLEVRAVAPAGVVVLVPARQVTALIYLMTTQRVVAAAADPGSTRTGEPAVVSLDQALEALR